MEVIVAIALIWGTVKASEWAAQEAWKFARAGAKKGRASYAARHPKTAAPAGRVGQAIGRTTAAGFHGAVAGGRGYRAGVKAGWPEGRQRAYDWQERRQQRRTSPESDVSGAEVHPFTPGPQQDERPAGTPIAVPGRRLPDRMPSRETVGSSALADPASQKQAWTVRMHWPDGVLREPFDLQHPESIAVWDEEDLQRRKAGLDDLVKSGRLKSYDVDEFDPTAARAALAAAGADDWEWEDDAMRGVPDDSTLQPGDAARFTILQNNGEWETHLTADRDGYERWRADAFQQKAAGEIRNFAIDTGPTDSTPGLAPLTFSTGGNNMLIETATGGDVVTLDDLITELGMAGKEASGDLADAAACAQRAQEDARRFETMVGALAGVDLDEQSLADIGALVACSTTRHKAAQTRLAAAELMVAKADAAIKNVLARHGQMQEAHDATPHAAEKTFYQR